MKYNVYQYSKDAKNNVERLKYCFRITEFDSTRSINGSGRILREHSILIVNFEVVDVI